MNRLKNFIRNINYLTKHSLWDQREEDILYLTNKIIDDVGYDYGLNKDGKINVLNTDETMKLLEEETISFVRIGDGELRIIGGEDQPFQRYEKEIAERLKHILSGQQKNLYVGLNYAYFSCFPFDYERRNAYDFRCVLRQLCNPNNIYIDAGVTCAQIPFVSKEIASPYVERWKHLFFGKDITIICGDHILDDYSYDIFALAKTKKFIYGSRRNAWDDHARLMQEIISTASKEEILVFILGMAGKVMIPELVDKGYTCWDVGHLAKYYEAYMTDMHWSKENTINFYKPD